MRKMRKTFAVLLTALFLTFPATTASAVGLTTNTDLIVPSLPDIFMSAHVPIKAVPVYRALVDDKVHWNTTNQDEFNYWISLKGINNDGITAYISPVALPYTVPMWNMVKNDVEQYFVTSEASRDYVIGKYGYQDCGIMGYVVSLDDAAHGNAQLYQWYRGNSDNFITDLNDIYGIDNGWDADHYYNTSVGYISSYDYQGPQFRVWNDASVLQEVDILSPNGGESLTGGSRVNITWETLIPGGNISLYYTLDPSQGWSVIEENLDNIGSYEWTVPNSAATKAIVEARWTYEGIDANCYDQSDKYFTIKTGGGTVINWAQTFKPLAMGSLLEPSSPTNLTAYSNLLQMKPKLLWKDNSSNETGFVIERKTSEGSYSELAKIGENKTQYIDNTAVEGTTYYYRVKAVNGKLSSGYSNEVAKSAYTVPKADSSETEETTGTGGTDSGAVSMLFTLNKSSYTVNGETKTMDVSPVSVNGRTLLPIRFAADPIGAETVWNSDEKKVTVTLGSTKLEIWIGSNTAKLNGESIQIDPDNPDVMPVLLNNRTMLPMRFVTEKLGCEVEWLPDLKQIKVDYLDPQPEPPKK